MPTPESNLIKDLKTIGVLAVSEGLIALLLEGNTGTAVGVATFVSLVSYMHEVGAERRAGSSILNGFQQIFSRSTAAARLDIYNTYRNISNGGAKIYDDAANGAVKIAQNFMPANNDAPGTQALLTPQQTRALEEMREKFGNTSAGDTIINRAQATYAKKSPHSQR